MEKPGPSSSRAAVSLPTSSCQHPEAGGRPVVFLLPGRMHVSATPCQVVTILGSCVAVCLWEADSKLGGINHFLLPNWRQDGGLSMRFADMAIPALLQRMLEMGAKRERITAKLFGGGALHRGESEYASSLGAGNVEAARRLLAFESISVVAQDTGGFRGRKVIFHTDEGIAWSKPV